MQDLGLVSLLCQQAELPQAVPSNHDVPSVHIDPCSTRGVDSFEGLAARCVAAGAGLEGVSGQTPAPHATGSAFGEGHLQLQGTAEVQCALVQTLYS